MHMSDNRLVIVTFMCVCVCVCIYLDVSQNFIQLASMEVHGVEACVLDPDNYIQSILCAINSLNHTLSQVKYNTNIDIDGFTHLLSHMDAIYYIIERLRGTFCAAMASFDVNFKYVVHSFFDLLSEIVKLFFVESGFVEYDPHHFPFNI